MIRVLASDGMETSAVEKLRSLGFEVVEQFYEPEDLKTAVQEFDALVVRSATKVRAPIIDAAVDAGRLKVVIRGGVGVDNIDVAYAVERGLHVTNTPNASSSSVAELAMAHMFTLARKLHSANVSMREGKWDKKNLEGIELAGKTLGVVGIGRIGLSLANRAAAIGMNVVYNDILGPRQGVDFKFLSFDELLAASDFISLHIPNADKPVIGSDEIAKLKNGAYLINTSRGNLISETALLEGLASGKIAGAALDVFAEEPTKNEAIYTHPKISLSPHIGASTEEAQTRIGEEIVTILTEFFPR